MQGDRIASCSPRFVTTNEIYRGVLPIIAIQVFVLGFLLAFPLLATWLPEVVYTR